jgi:tRNA nucleotidyltransferase/poly(A) polymerase
MANVFGILTAIVLALSAFVAFKNKEHYAADIIETQTQKDNLRKSEARLDVDEKEKNVTKPGEIAAVNAEVDQLSTAEATQKKANDDLTAKVSEKTAKIASNKDKLDDIRVKTEKSGNINELAAKLRATSAELVGLAASIDGATGKLANLTAQNAATDAQVSASKGKFENFANGQSLPELNTRIRSIYPNWGFVTLAAGNNAGVVTNSTLNVVRNGETIAKLLVTAVESSSASASIIPDSMASDVTLMVGDRVVPGTKATAKTPGN